MFTHKYPYTNFHELNLDYLLDSQSKIEKKLETIDADVKTAEINAQIAKNAGDKIDALINKHCLVVGDSYGKGWSQSGAIYTPYTSYAANYTGVMFENISDSGAGFTHNGDITNKNFKALMESYEGDADKISDVFFMGGYNDRGSAGNTIIQAMTSAIASAKAKFKNAHIHVGFIGWSTNANEYVQLDNAKIAYQSCINAGASYMHNIEFTMHRSSNFDPDGIHPNTNGQNAIGDALASCFLSGSCTVHYPQAAISITPASNVTLDTVVRQELYNGQLNTVVFDHFNVSNMQVFGEHTLNGSEEFDVGTVSSFYGAGYNGIVATVPCVIGLSNNNVVIGIAKFRVVNKHIYVNLTALDNNTFITGTLSYISIGKFNIASSSCVN